jgi:hypothetical protein
MHPAGLPIRFQADLMRPWRTTWLENKAVPQRRRNEYKGLMPIFMADLMRLRCTTWHENGLQRSVEDTGQSVVQASLEGDCLEVGIHCGDTDPA